MSDKIDPREATNVDKRTKFPAGSAGKKVQTDHRAHPATNAEAAALYNARKRNQAGRPPLK
jgi:hypothetical protein